MNLKIRRALLSDLKIIQNLNHYLFESDGERDEFLNHNWPYEEGEDYFKKRITSDECICLIAEIDGEIIGYLAGSLMETGSWRNVRRTELENMFVKSEYRSRGVGKALVEKFTEWSKEKNVQRILVDAYATNQKAINFYEREGFVQESISLEKSLL